VIRLRGLFLSNGKYELPLPDGMPEDALTKRFFAKMYGFTEEMTENSSADAITWWPLIEQAEADAEAKKLRDEQRRQRR
jgi:hypothetical protein